MKKFTVVFVALLLIGSIALGDDLMETIQVMFNQVNVTVDDVKVEADNILYDGKTYLPLRDTAKIVGMEVGWDSASNTAMLFSEKLLEEEYDPKALNLLSNYPREGISDAYLQWNYFTFKFDKEIAAIDDLSQIYLFDLFGNRVKIVEAIPGFDDKTILIVAVQGSLALDTYYTMYIPEKTIASRDALTYDKEILFRFKTSSNAVEGTIQSDEDYIDMNVVLSNSGHSYETTVLASNDFYFADVAPGNYVVRVLYGDELLLEDDMVVSAAQVNKVIVEEPRE